MGSLLKATRRRTRLHRWRLCLQKVPDTHKRLAAARLTQIQNFIYTPHASELALDNPTRSRHCGCAASPAAPQAAALRLGFYRAV